VAKESSVRQLALWFVVILSTACATGVGRTEIARAPVVTQAGATAETVTRWSAEDARAELADLYASLKSAHYNLFAFRTEKDYDERYAATRSRIRSGMSTLDLVRAFQPFVAFARVGHARIEFPIQDYIAAAQRNEKILPLDFRFDAGRVLVAHNYTGDVRLKPGTEILAIDGRPIADEVAAIARYVSAETSYLNNAQLEEFFPRWFWLDRGSVETVTLETASGPGGSRARVAVSGMPIGAAEPMKSEWTTRFHGREVRVLEDKVAYLRPGPFYNVEGGDSMDVAGFRTFVDGAFGTIIAAGAEDLIVDLRNNPGGDNSFSDLLIAWFADRPFRFSSAFRLKVSTQTLDAYRPKPGEPSDREGIVSRMYDEMSRRSAGETFLFDLPLARPRDAERYRGRVFVLVNRHSYSNSASMAALVQDYGFGRIMGEETADLPTSYASSMQLTLPRTKIAVTYPKSYFVRPSGDQSLRGVVPDHGIDTPPAGVDDSDDPVLRRAISILRPQPQ
jgi:hypothetical protein